MYQPWGTDDIASRRSERFRSGSTDGIIRIYSEIVNNASSPLGSKLPFHILIFHSGKGLKVDRRPLALADRLTISRAYHEMSPANHFPNSSGDTVCRVLLQLLGSFFHNCSWKKSCNAFRYLIVLSKNKVKDDRRKVQVCIYDGTIYDRGSGKGNERNSECCAMSKRNFIKLHTTTYESNNQPYTSSTLKILSSVTRAFAQVLHVHVTMGAAMLRRDEPTTRWWTFSRLVFQFADYANSPPYLFPDAPCDVIKLY